MTKLHNDYYTYAYLREDKTPYYIGKGRGNRVYDKRRTIKPPADKSRILFLKKNLTEAEAFKHEIYMIFVLGRRDLGTGILRNRTDGGEGSSGAVRSAETKKKISESMSGENNPMYGVPKTEEWKQAKSESMSGEKNPMFGVCRTEEWKKANSERNSGEKHPMYGVPRTEEWKQDQSERVSGEKNPMYGRTGEKHPLFGVPRTEEIKKKISKAIIAIEPDGTQRHFGGGCEAARELGISQGDLCKYLKTGHVPTKGKFKDWQFLFKNSEIFNDKNNQ